MELASIFFLFFTLSLSTLVLLRIRRKNSVANRLPPGPPGWPVFGNMFDLGTTPHRSLTDLRNKYGDVVWLRFGAINTMAILSTKAVAEFFKNHDLSFADRNITETMRVFDYNKSSLALASYGSYWRVLRRLVTVDMQVTKRINETASLRRKSVDDLLLWIEEEARKVEKGRGIHVVRVIFLASFNLIGKLMVSRDLIDSESKVGSEFFTAMMGIGEWSGHANAADFFPWLRWVDPQGLCRKMKRDLGKALEIASGFVRERVEERRGGGERKKDFLDVLLEFEGSGNEEPDKFSDRDINVFILEIFMAGSETTSMTTEWALTELLRNPKSMMKIKEELNLIVGRNRKVEEADIDNLPYLQAVVKETMRLHPPLPFLVPRRAIHDTNFMGYHIPENTQVLVNTWAVGRDPDAWEEPLCFKPERFIGSKIDYKGQYYELIPFGAGRRMCAGVPLAHRMLHLTLGSLLHHFEWELDSSVTPETIDMRERLGITMRKFEPLLAVPN